MATDFTLDLDAKAPALADLHAKLNAETDARFAAQTGITRKLDPHNPIDAKLVPVWVGINQKVLAELASPGGVHFTYDRPVVASQLAAAAAASTAAADSLHAAATALTVADAHQHLADAHQHAATAAAAATVAASVQPPSVDHSLLARAAHAVRNLVVHGIDDVRDAIRHVDEWHTAPSGSPSPPPSPPHAATVAVRPDDAVTALQANAAPDHAAAAAPAYPEPSRPLPPSSGPSTRTAAIIFGVAILGTAGAFVGLSKLDKSNGARRHSGRRRRR